MALTTQATAIMLKYAQTMNERQQKVFAKKVEQAINKKGFVSGTAIEKVAKKIIGIENNK